MALKRERGATNQRTRERHFMRDPLCVRCLEKNPPVTRLWTQLDHIVPLINGGTNDDSNRQGLCDECHAAKSATEAGKTYRSRTPIGLDGWPMQ
jgi:5-methylcytosine-specific restriction protein A